MPDSGLRVAVLGVGPVGLGSAALLATREHTQVLWSPYVETVRGAVVSDEVKAGRCAR